MNVLSFFKQLKRRLRWKRRWLLLGSWIVLALTGLSAVWLIYENGKSASDQSVKVTVQQAVSGERGNPAVELDLRASVLERIKSEAKVREVIKKNQYICGQEAEPMGRMTPQEIVRLHEQNSRWELTLNEQGQAVFTEHIDDLSPQCKQNAYFGLDKNGNLSLFEGLPKDDNVMRTFFQINVGYMESSLPQEIVRQLHEGIRVTDLAEYNSVLSTFSDFAVEDTEKVLSPQK